MLQNSYFVVLFIFLLFSTKAKSQHIKADHIGIIAEFTFMKHLAENKAFAILNDSTISSDTKKKFILNYNTTCVLVDQVLLQLIADCKRKNNIHFYKKLDKLFNEYTVYQIIEKKFKKTKLNNYVININKINNSFEQLVSINNTDSTLAYNKMLLENSIGIIDSITFGAANEYVSIISSTIKGVQEYNAKKVEGITFILNELRLQSLQNLMDATKKEEKK